ncbi:methyltransferase [Aureococcus anophagefferens]|nr:methyltransferase [Aureococcus anophagefferens]
MVLSLNPQRPKSGGHDGALARRRALGARRRRRRGRRGPSRGARRRGDAEELAACGAWATLPRHVLGAGAAQRECPIDAFHASRAVDNRDGRVAKVRFGKREFAPPRGWGLPKDAIHLCAFVSRLLRSGALNASAAPRPVLLDVGAAFGGETVAAGLLGFDVVAFEPNVDEHARLQAAWGATAGTRVVHAAVTRRPSEVTLHLAGDSSSLEAIKQDAARVKARRERVREVAVCVGNDQWNALSSKNFKPLYLGQIKATVRGVAIDGELEAVGGVDPARVAVVKLDIQGHEYEALAGAAKLLRERHPVLYFEYTPELYARREDANRAFCLAKYVGGYDCVKPPPAAAVQNAGEMAYCVPEGWRAAFPTHDAPCGGGAVEAGTPVTKICEDGPAPPVPAPARGGATGGAAGVRGRRAPARTSRASRSGSPRRGSAARRWTRGASGRALCAAPRAAAARGRRAAAPEDGPRGRAGRSIFNLRRGYRKKARRGVNNQMH